VLLDERSVAILPAPAPSIPTRGARRLLAGGWGLVAVSVALAALSLLAPSAPTYDPWAWIIWGREVAHLDLVTTGGPSWKPLPVLFTTIFSLFGEAAPALWLVAARAGAIAAVLLAFRVARRLGGGVPGGMAAAAALAIAPWWIKNAALGNSEGLIVAFLLATIDRELAGDRRAAFLFAVCAGLLRPEAWPFLTLYGLWLLWRRQLPLALILGAGAGVLALWLLPEWWGSGDALRAAHRAKDVNPGAPTYDDNPAIAELRAAAEMLTVPLMVGLAGAVAMLAIRRDRALGLIVGLAVAWIGVVVYMTSDGFSGNQRYLMAPLGLLIVVAGAGAGWLLGQAAHLVWRNGARPPSVPRAVLAAGALLVAIGFSAPSYANFAPALRSVHYQADLINELPGLVERAGGAAALRRCGPSATGPFLVPAVAWSLRVHTQEVLLEAQTPGVVFRERTRPTARSVPSLRGLAPQHTLAVGDNWRIVSSCPSASG
jgi:hypothetical protein